MEIHPSNALDNAAPRREMDHQIFDLKQGLFVCHNHRATAYPISAFSDHASFSVLRETPVA
jgi:hypothetical protein